MHSQLTLPWTGPLPSASLHVIACLVLIIAIYAGRALLFDRPGQPGLTNQREICVTSPHTQ